MGLFEIEVSRTNFADLVSILVGSSPIPDPTLEVLGDDRLITSFTWKNVTLGQIAPGLEPPPGQLAARAEVTIGHASLAELEVDAWSEVQTQAVAWIFVSLKGSGTTWSLAASLIRIDVAGKPLTARFDQPASKRFGRPPLGVQRIPLTGLPTVVAAAVLMTDGTAAIRFATHVADGVLSPPADRRVGFDTGWLIRLSPEIFTDMLSGQMQKILTPPPSGTVIEEPLTVEWGQLPTPENPFATEWGVGAAVGLKKPNACKGIFGSVDVSVDVGVSLLLRADPNEDGGTLTEKLVVTTDASDWDSFRCWVTKGLPALGLLGGLISLAAVGDTVGGMAGGAAHQPVGAGFTEVASSESMVIYQRKSRLPSLAAVSPTATVDNAEVGAMGLLIGGSLTTIGTTYHDVSFSPAPGTELDGAWSAGYSCSEGRWTASYQLPKIHITDAAMIGLRNLGGTKFVDREVAIFRTSAIVPPEHWRIDYPPTVPDQWVQVVGDELLASTSSGDGRLRPFLTWHGRAPAGHVFLHTSAGLRRYNIGAVDQAPAPPSPAVLGHFAINCKNWGQRWVTREMQAHWLVDPPPFDYGYRPLRQWMLTMAELPEGGRVDVYAARDAVKGERLATVTAETTGCVAVEVVTDESTELLIEHNLQTPPTGARLSQRWLLPTEMTSVDATNAMLRRSGAGVLAIPSTEANGLPPYSMRLRGGKVAALHSGQLVVAFPFGGSGGPTRRKLGEQHPTREAYPAST